MSVDLVALKRRLDQEYQRGMDGDEAAPECDHDEGTCRHCGSQTNCAGSEYHDQGCPHECPECEAEHPCSECGHQSNCCHSYQCDECSEDYDP